MVTLASSLNIAVNSLNTTQTALGTVSHNLANVNTAGYVRQEVIIGNVAIEGFGAGSKVIGIRRVVDTLLQGRIVEQNSAVGHAQMTSDFMDNLEVIFGTPGAASSTEKLVGDMFNTMSTLANSPDNSSLQLNVVKSAEFVVDTVRAINTELNEAALRADTLIDNELSTINNALKNIKELNQEISEILLRPEGGANANDLIDERQRQVLIVSERINVNISTDEGGRVNLSAESGRKLVDSNYVILERIAPTPPSLFGDIGARPIGSDGLPKSNVFPILTDKITDGSIRALIDMRDTQIPNMVAQMDEFSKVMINEFNLVHSQGTGVPPQNSLTSGNGFRLTTPADDIFDPTGMNLTAGGTFDISVVDPATGAPIATTLAAGGGTLSINLGAGPLTLGGVAALINGNPDIGGLVTASTVIDANGDTQLEIVANNPAQAIVLGNQTGNPLGELGMNNFFTGQNSSDIAIREDIIASPSLIATARMRTSDGGFSGNDNRNIIEIGKLADKDVSFDAAGGMSTRTDSITGYFIGISSNLAITLQNNSERLDFQTRILDDMEQRQSSISGVNVDEELSKLLIFQNSYQASAKIISIIDELLETLVNLI